MNDYSSFNILSLKIDEDFSNLSFDEEFQKLYVAIYEDSTSLNNYMVITILNSIKIFYKKYSKVGALYNLECLYYMLYYKNLDIREENKEIYHEKINVLGLSPKADYDAIFHELGHAIHYNIYNDIVPRTFKNNISNFIDNNEEKIDEITLKLLECINRYKSTDKDKKLSIFSVTLISDLLSGIFYLNKNSFYNKYSFYHIYNYYHTKDDKLNIKALYMESFANYNVFFIRNGNITFPFLDNYNGNDIMNDIESVYYSKMKQKYHTLLREKGLDFLYTNKIQNIINESYQEKLRKLNYMNNSFYKRIKKIHGKKAIDYIIQTMNHPNNSLDYLQLKKINKSNIILLYSYSYDKYKKAILEIKTRSKYEKEKKEIIDYYFNTDIYNFNDYILDYYKSNISNNNLFSDGDLLYYIIKYYNGNSRIINQIIEEKLLSVNNKNEMFKVKEKIVVNFIYSLQALYENTNVFLDYYGIKYYINSSISYQSTKIKEIVERIHNKIDNCGILNNPIKEVFITKNNDLIEEKYEDKEYCNLIVIKYSNDISIIDNLIDKKIPNMNKIKRK